MDIVQENRISTDVEDYGSRSRSSIEAQREIIRQSLPGITSEITMLMRNAKLDFPIFVCLPRSGSALVTIATVLDPSDAQFTEATKIACGVLERILGGMTLCGRALECTTANATMSATDVVVDAHTGP